MKLQIGLAAFFTVMAGYLFYQLGGAELLGGVTGVFSGAGCKIKHPLSSAPTLAEMIAISEANAKAWKPDAVLMDVIQSKLRPDGSGGCEDPRL